MRSMPNTAPTISTARMMHDRIGAFIGIRPSRSSPNAMLLAGGSSIISTWISLSRFFSSMLCPVLTSAQDVQLKFGRANDLQGLERALTLENIRKIAGRGLAGSPLVSQAHGTA